MDELDQLADKAQAEVVDQLEKQDNQETLDLQDQWGKVDHEDETEKPENLVVGGMTVK